MQKATFIYRLPVGVPNTAFAAPSIPSTSLVFGSKQAADVLQRDYISQGLDVDFVKALMIVEVN